MIVLSDLQCQRTVSICVCVCHTTRVYTQYGISALMFAAMEGETEVVVELVKAGANVDMQNEVCSYMYVNTFVVHNL